VRADPLPKKNVPAELSHGTMVISDSGRPVAFADGFEVKRGMQCVF
jgi:hypothetical protein